eukprot:900071-Amphidinium_carterae.1
MPLTNKTTTVVFPPFLASKYDVTDVDKVAWRLDFTVANEATLSKYGASFLSAYQPAAAQPRKHPGVPEVRKNRRWGRTSLWAPEAHAAYLQHLKANFDANKEKYGMKGVEL